MKYEVMANLQFNTPASEDALKKALQTQLVGRPTWGETGIASGIHEVTGKPEQTFRARFNTESDMNDIFSWLKTRMDNIPVLSGSVRKHYCDHDEPSPTSCQILEEYQK